MGDYLMKGQCNSTMSPGSGGVGIMSMSCFDLLQLCPPWWSWKWAKAIIHKLISLKKIRRRRIKPKAN